MYDHGVDCIDRYRLLPSVECRMDFLRLQLELLDDFRIRLLQVKKEIFPNRADHLNQQYCAIVNTVNYINDVLCQWANLPVSAAWFFGTSSCPEYADCSGFRKK